jgi:hypothetical protein
LETPRADVGGNPTAQKSEKVHACPLSHDIVESVGMHAAHKVGSVQGGSDSLERRHWEFSFDNRPTNQTWSWRLVCDEGRSVERSIAFKDLRCAVDDAIKRGFSPASGDWVVRGVPLQPRPAAHERATALSA